MLPPAPRHSGQQHGGARTRRIALVGRCRRVRVLQCRFEPGNDLPYRTRPEHRHGQVFPARPGRVENGIVPEKAPVLATGGIGLPWFCGAGANEVARHEMLRVPELPDARVSDACQRNGGRRTPVRGQHRLPHHQDVKIGVGIPREKFFDCGGPPQTRQSGGRKKQQESRALRGFVKRSGEFRESPRGQSN